MYAPPAPTRQPVKSVYLECAFRSCGGSVFHPDTCYDFSLKKKMHAPVRIAVLECDTPPEKTNLQYGGYHGVFSNLLHRSAEMLGQPDKLDPHSGLEISQWDVVTEQTYPALESVDAIVLTGSSEFHCIHDNALDIQRLTLCRAQLIRGPSVDREPG